VIVTLLPRVTNSWILPVTLRVLLARELPPDLRDVEIAAARQRADRGNELLQREMRAAEAVERHLESRIELNRLLKLFDGLVE